MGAVWWYLYVWRHTHTHTTVQVGHSKYQRYLKISSTSSRGRRRRPPPPPGDDHGGGKNLLARLAIAAPVVAKPIHVEVKRRYRRLSSGTFGPRGRVRERERELSIELKAEPISNRMRLTLHEGQMRWVQSRVAPQELFESPCKQHRLAIDPCRTAHHPRRPPYQLATSNYAWTNEEWI
jgi:hypothetical protein